MADRIFCPDDLDNEQMAELIVDMFTRIAVHYGLWFTEVRHQMGMEKALDVLHTATRQGVGFALKRFSKLFDFPVENGLPADLVRMPRDRMESLMEAVAKNWLANDGVWFQAVESDSGMNDAKRCNDSCWAQFSPFEASAIKRFLRIEDNCGLDGLKKALNFRMYSLINAQSIVDESPQSFVFQMNDCRVQSARKRRNLADYPCKSAGLVEYAYFAKALDRRIQTQCIGCPPDDHPKEWFCAWRFFIEIKPNT